MKIHPSFIIIVLNKKIGDEVKSGEVLAYIHTDDDSKVLGATQNLTDAFVLSPKPVKQKSRVITVI